MVFGDVADYNVRLAVVDDIQAQERIIELMLSGRAAS